MFDSTSDAQVTCTSEHEQLIERVVSEISIHPPVTENPEKPTSESRDNHIGQVIIPEIINEFSQYASPPQNVQVVLSLKAKAADVNISKTKIAITSVLDVSGSMDGPRIELLKGTSHFLAEELTTDDYLGLVSYSSLCHELLPLCKMSPAAKKLAHCLINSLQANGGTALYDGLLLGLQQILTSKLPEPSSFTTGVLLCTDGQANEGPSTADAILPKLHAEKAKLNGSTTIHCFGIGLGHDASLLQSLSESFSGSYYFLAKHENIASGYGDLLASLKSTVAKDISVLIKTMPGIKIQKILSGADFKTTPEGAMEIKFSNLFDGESREILLQFNNHDGPSGDGQKRLADVIISYTDLVTGSRIEQCLPFEIRQSIGQGQLPAAPEPSHPLVVSTTARFDTRSIIERAGVESEMGRLSEAEAILRSHALKLSTMLAKVSLNQSTSQDTVKGAESMLGMLKTQVEAVADLTKSQAIASEKQRQAPRLDVQSKAAYKSASTTLSQQRASNVGGPSDLPASQTYDSEVRKASRAKAVATASGAQTF